MFQKKDLSEYDIFHELTRRIVICGLFLFFFRFVAVIVLGGLLIKKMYPFDIVFYYVGKIKNGRKEDNEL